VRRLRKYFSLPPSERWLLFRGALLLGVFRLALWILPFQNLARLVPRAAPNAQPSEADAALAGRIAWAVELASRYAPKTTCLVKALAVHALLAQEGLPAVVRVGVTKGDEARFQAHAWVEVHGKVVLGGDLGAYAPLPAWNARDL
jgi:hypothetical protein